MRAPRTRGLLRGRGVAGAAACGLAGRGTEPFARTNGLPVDRRREQGDARHTNLAWVAGRDLRASATHRPAGRGRRAFCAGERFAGCRLASSDTALRFAASTDNRDVARQSRLRPIICNGFWKLLPKMTRMRAKPRPQAYRHRETAVRAPNSQRKPRNQGRIRAEQHALARFLAADPPDPFLTVPRSISPSQAPDQRLPAHRPKPAPPTSNPSDHRTDPNPLTNTPPRHRPDAGEPHGATPYCACATPSPSGAPTGQAPLPLCAQHHPSSIRS